MTLSTARCLVLCLALLLSAASAPAQVVELSRYENRDYLFVFHYPSDWQLSPAPAGDLRVRVSAPAGGPQAQCSVLVKRYPNAAKAKQEEIDQVFLAPPNTAEVREMLGDEEPELEVLSVTAATLHNRPAHGATLRYPVATLTGPARAYGRVVLTATPGLTWTLVCSGQGATEAEAENNFASWSREIDNLMASFRFAKMTKRAPAARPAAPAAKPAVKPAAKPAAPASKNGA